MALKNFKPITPSLRQLVIVDRTGLWKGKPVKALTKGKVDPAGRNNHGHITSRFRGGGHKQSYRIVDFKRRKRDVVAVVERLEYVNPIGGIGWWANKLKKHADLDSGEINSQIRFFMRYLLPLSAGLGTVTRNVFGQSLILEARRT